MELTIKDRLVIGGFFKAEGNEEEILLQRAIREKCEITEDEKKLVNLMIDKETNVYSWEEDNEVKTIISLSPKELTYLDKRREALNAESKMNEMLIDTALKIKEEAN